MRRNPLFRGAARRVLDPSGDREAAGLVHDALSAGARAGAPPPSRLQGGAEGWHGTSDPLSLGGTLLRLAMTFCTESIVPTGNQNTESKRESPRAREGKRHGCD
ncbi:hypothetical protein AAFF_G00114700 [Aldrovandia affinis]|uniref:Uncharacterized protein n=1 Tax=Aldrovandia affinis TaxID=143900 RepID=A0AAD7RSV6_9TELE|nr:hypothetical protein AAFF_G00114700 [Aldrovandia affinis]